MWLYLIAVALLIVGAVGALLGGGIFTIVLIPIALLAFAAAALFGMWGRAAQGSAGGETEDTHTTDRPLPSSGRRPGGSLPSSPEALADARRAQQ